MGQHMKLKAAIETGPDIRETLVPAPLQTWAGLLHQIDIGAPNPGRERAMVDRRTLLGGFCRFRGTEAQEKAAAKFKSVYERSQVGGAKAVDPSREAVDGGGINPESVIEMGADARRLYNQLHQTLGAPKMRCLEFVVIGENGPTAYARWRYREKQPDGRAIGRASVEMRSIVERVAVLWKLQTRAA